MRYAITIESCVHPETKRKRIGFVQGKTMREIIFKLGVDPKELGRIRINLYLKKIHFKEIVYDEEISSPARFMAVVLQYQAIWQQKN